MSHIIKSLTLIILLTLGVQASGLYVKVLSEPMEDVEDSLKESFTQNNLKEVARINIYEKMLKSGLAKKMGNDWNKNELSGLVSYIVCNGKLGMNIANANAQYAGICPIKITLIEDKKGTTLTYMRASNLTSDDKLKKELKVLDQTVIKAIEDLDSLSL
ncbi:DUF302 domain-containing protein [Sulfuricurvum sp.]|uniref:DUF302 domain-containing protein n=1 Tax=Sulfuricurvum sp. TaxID=2025608 RepID=UPI0026389D7A|nr:DUF302 domain-containing protein [Sulfuricurvum sp.]MDD3597357.1 DUF302 domain-containing protein [Sulfuricurvum sp.]